MLNKKALTVLIAVLALAIFLTGCGDKSVAEVNGTKISQNDYDKRVSNYIQSIENQGYGEMLQGEEGQAFMNQIKKDTLEEMIIHQVLYQEAASKGILPEISLVEEKIDEIKAQLSPEEFEQALKDSNWTEKDLEDYFYEQLVEMAVYEEVTKDVNVAEEVIVDFYQQYKDQLASVRASHILVETEAEALEIIAQLEQGADFAQLANEKSMDTMSALNGGDLDYFSRGRMVAEFDEAAFSLLSGEITTEPVETQYGYHIIKVVDKKDSLEQLKPEIEEIISVDEKAALFDEYITDLQENAKITKNLKID